MSMLFAGFCCLGMTKFCLFVAWIKSLWLPRKWPPLPVSKLYFDFIRPTEDTIREGGSGVMAEPVFAFDPVSSTSLELSLRRYGVKVFPLESACWLTE